MRLPVSSARSSSGHRRSARERSPAAPPTGPRGRVSRSISRRAPSRSTRSSCSKSSPGEGWLDVRIDLRCAPGTYVRSIARDLGERLGTGAHLHALRRTEAAGLLAQDALTPDRLEALAAQGRLAEAVRPVGGLLSLPAVTLDSDSAWRFVHGASQAHDGGASGRVKVLDEAGELIGVGSVTGGELRPEKVVPQVQGA